MDIKSLLTQVKEQTLSVEEAESLLKRAPFQNLDFAKIDTHRSLRQGMAEVVFCQGKAGDHLVRIYQSIYETEGEVFGTRASEEQFALIQKYFEAATYDEKSRVLKIEKKNKIRRGQIIVCTAGTADIAVAEEAAQTAEFFGSNVKRIFDVGVSGLHRLLSQVETLQKANCVVAIAGMEGALASVIGGLVSCPVIAVPTSVGYGASFNGLAALLTMINSCANGVSVVNIDNGYGAGYISHQINKMVYEKESA